MKEYFLDILIRPHYKKKLFGKKYILYKDYRTQSYISSNYYITLGYMYRDIFPTFLKLFFPNPNTDFDAKIEQLSGLGELVKQRVNYETRGLYELFSETQTKPFIEMYNKSKNQNLDYKNIFDLYKINDSEVPINVAEELEGMMIYSLIAFGYKYPELTEHLMSYSNTEKDKNLASKYGIETQDKIKTEEYKSFAKELIKPFVKLKRPELTKILNL